MNLNQLNRLLLQTLFLPVIALLCVSIALARQIVDGQQTVAQIEAADNNIAALHRIATLIVDEESGVRGYQATANEIFLQPYTLSIAPLASNLASLRGSLVHQHSDTTLLDILADTQQHWRRTVAEPIIALVAAGPTADAEVARDPALNLRGKAQMDAMRQLLLDLIRDQETNRDRLSDRWRSQVHGTLTAILIAALVVGLLIGLFARSRLHRVSTAFQQALNDQGRIQAALLTSEKLAVAGRLAAAIAHEIHNPLDAAINLLYLLQQDAATAGLPAEATQYLTLAQAELARVTQISRSMLGLYRESRTPIPLDLAEVLTSVLRLLDHTLQHARIAVSTDLEPGTVAAGYPAELHQVFTNLLTNAADAAIPGTALAITLRSQPPTPTTPAGVLVRIADTGSGIDAAALEHIFQPFFTTKGERGTGLGLWISHSIVEKHGGTIRVESNTTPAGHGTTFSIFLPREAPTA